MSGNRKQQNLRDGHRRSLVRDPANRAALIGLCAALDELGERGTPQEAVARANLGEDLRQQGQSAEALGHLLRARDWLPHFGGIHFQMGSTFQDLGRLEEAAVCYGRAAGLMPKFAAAPSNQGAMLRSLGRMKEAEAALRTALRIDPQLGAAWANLAAVLAAGKDQKAALAACHRALALLPTTAECWMNLASLLREQGRVADTITALERALASGLADPGNGLSQLLQQRRNLCRWDGLSVLSARLVDLVSRNQTRNVLPWNFLGEGAGPALERRVAENYTAWRCAGILPLPAVTANSRLGDGRLRIGYLSSDFHDHATALLIAELIECHDRTGFEIIGLSYGPDDDSATRRRLIAGFDRFVDLQMLSHQAAAQAIRTAGVDILIDLKGHTQGGRVEIAAYRPAPVQAQWLGYPGTVGASFFDYIIADPVVAPFAHEAGYTERIVQLPVSYQPNDRTRAVGPVPRRADCGLPEQGFVFCSFNAPYKIGPDLFDRWCRILSRVEGSVLWLLQGPDEAGENLRREAGRRGVSPDRLIFAPRLPLTAHLARHRLADLFLDSWPIGAHTTASDALWAGLPVLSVLGESFASRVSASLARAVGQVELVMAHPDGYEEMAVTLALEPARLGRIRSALERGRGVAPLFDTDRLARELEAACKAMWQFHISGQPPVGFAVTPPR